MVKTVKIKDLRETYEKVCNDYVQIFCDKQKIDFEGWVCDNAGGTACCGDFFFYFPDIVWDVNSKQPEGTIVDWYHENMELPEKSINYYSYTKGLRVSDIE
jgi:hypothetical protein